MGSKIGRPRSHNGLAKTAQPCLARSILIIGSCNQAVCPGIVENRTISALMQVGIPRSSIRIPVCMNSTRRIDPLSDGETSENPGPAAGWLRRARFGHPTASYGT